MVSWTVAPRRRAWFLCLFPREQHHDSMGRENQLVIGSWVALTGVSLIVALVAKNASYRQLAIGILTASAVLLGMMLLFEAAWWLAIRTLEFRATIPLRRSRSDRSRNRPIGFDANEFTRLLCH